MALVSGQPGIGKTHLVRAFASKAEAAGVLCLFGICDEDAAVPSYWPWVQIERALISQGEDTELSRLLGDEPDLINALLPATELSTKIHIRDRATGANGVSAVQHYQRALYRMCTAQYLAADNR